MTGLCSKRSAHWMVSGSARSPARNSVRNFDRSYFEKCLPSGSSFLMARNAVGAVKILHRPLQRDHVAAVVADHALRDAGGARGVEDIERIGGADRHRFEHIP